MSKKFAILAIVAVLASLLVPAAAFAQTGSTYQTWTSSITYYTPSDTAGTLQVDFYGSDGMQYSAPAIAMAPHKAGSLLVGSVSTVPASFSGSAVLSSDVQVVATAVQFAAGAEAGNFGRLLYSGFSDTNAASTFYIPTFLNMAFGTKTSSRVGVQNVEGFAINANLKFYATGVAAPQAEKNVSIPAQSSYIFQPADIAGLPSPFNGSLVITGTKVGEPATPGRVVAASQETSETERFAYAFEGVAQGANKVYMASMLCQAGASSQKSFYAVQNAGTGNATVTITAYNTTGAQVGQIAGQVIAQGGKMSFDPCTFTTPVPAGTSGSAVIESTGAPVIAIGKVNSANGLNTAFLGQASGSTKSAAPYIRYAADPAQDYRAFIAIMNVGAAAANNVQVKYYDGNGTLKATHNLTSGGPLGQYIKRNSDAQTAGATTGGAFGFTPPGGAIEVTSDQPVVVVVRLSKNVNFGAVTVFGEDYNGVPVP